MKVDFFGPGNPSNIGAHITLHAYSDLDADGFTSCGLEVALLKHWNLGYFYSKDTRYFMFIIGCLGIAGTLPGGSAKVRG